MPWWLWLHHGERAAGTRAAVALNFGKLVGIGQSARIAILNAVPVPWSSGDRACWPASPSLPCQPLAPSLFADGDAKSQKPGQEQPFTFTASHCPRPDPDSSCRPREYKLVIARPLLHLPTSHPQHQHLHTSKHTRPELLALPSSL